MYVCVHTVDRYDLEIALTLTLKFLMGFFLCGAQQHFYYNFLSQNGKI